MPRIQDIGAFNAVRERVCELVPPVPRIAVGMGTCGRGNGAEGLYTPSAAIEHSGATCARASGLLWGLLSGTAGQRSPARKSSGDSAAGAGQ